MDTLYAILALLVFFVQVSDGAERVDVKFLLQHAWQKRHVRSTEFGTNYASSFLFKRNAGSVPMNDLDDVMALDTEASLRVVHTANTVQGTQLFKMQEMYKGQTVPEAIVTLEMDREGRQVLDASGTVYRHIDLDLAGHGGGLDSERALTVCLRHHFDDDLREEITHVKTEEQVLIDDQMNPYVGYFVQYLVLLEGEERRPTCVINATQGTVIMSWDALDSCTDCEATGTGGNVKIGKIRYGELQRCLKLRRENGTCYMENKYVRVIHNNFTMAERDHENAVKEVASYDCEESDDEVNGGYSPLLDALFYGTVVGKMYEDWYNISPLGETITFRVHYGVNVSNAFWNGYECQYGDGGEVFHPLTSLDIVGHEIGHGLTEKNSHLYYFNQWGGINEAFSDMAGEAAEAYLGETDLMVGLDVTKSDNPLRYFENPEADNSSIGHVDNYTEYMDPHHSSGVYNRVFYLLVHDYEIPIKDAFHVFLHANQMYWHHMSTYVKAACDVMKSAYDLGQNGSLFRRAFEEVGIEMCDLEDHVLGLRNGKPKANITVSKHVSPFFVFGVPGEFAGSVTVNASSSQGDVYIVVSNKTWQGNEAENVVIYAEGLSSVGFDVPDNTSLHLSVSLSTQSATPLTDVTLVASHDCLEEYEPNEGDVSTYYLYFLWKHYCEKDKNDTDSSDDTDKDDGETPGDRDDEKDVEQNGKTTPAVITEKATLRASTGDALLTDAETSTTTQKASIGEIWSLFEAEETGYIFLQP